MRWIDIRQLKNLRRFPVPPEVLAAGRVKLIAVIDASPMRRRPSAWFMSAAWRPVMAVMVVVVVATGGGTFAAAHEALPGDRLYVLKLATEEVRERLSFSPERRFAVQAAHASRRLEETERLLGREGLVASERVTRVRAAMDLYEGHLFAMNEIVVRFEADAEKPEKGKKAITAAERTLDRHVRLIESATRAEPYAASLMLAPIGDALEMESDLFAAIPADDGGTDDGRERRSKDRAKRIEDSLKRFRAEIEERRARESRDEEREDDDRAGGEVRDRDEDGGDGADMRFETRFETPLEIKLEI